MSFDIISYQGPNHILVWKHDIVNFNMGSQLIVDDSQEAIFYKDGQALDLFGGGRHELKPENIPLLRKIFEAFTKSKTIFTCQVYYINKVVTQELMWGTNTAIQMMDPLYDIQINVKSYGSYKIRVNNARKFMMKTVGTVKEFNTENLQDYFKSEMMAHIKSQLTKEIRIQKVSIIDINAYLVDIAANIQKALEPVFDVYGLELMQLSIASIKANEDDLAVLKDAKNNAMRRRTEGYTYHEERSFNTLEKAADNPGAGTLMGAGIGLGVGAVLGGKMGDTMQQNIQTKALIICPNCQEKNDPSMQFCQSCGTKLQAECPSCHAKVKPGQKFCTACGTNLMQKNSCKNCQSELEPNAKFCPHCGEKQ